MEGETSILDEIRDTGESVEIYGVSASKEIGPRSVGDAERSKQGQSIYVVNDNKNKIGKEKVKKRVTKCTVRGCKYCPPQNTQYLTKEEYDLGIGYKRQVGDSAVPMNINTQNYCMKPKMNPNERLKESSDNAVLSDEDKKSQNTVISSYNQNFLDAETSDLRVLNNLVTQGNETKWIKCTDKGCKECSKYHSECLQEQLDNYNKQDISEETHDQQKMSESDLKDFVVPSNPLSPADQQQGFVSSIVKKVGNDLKRQIDPTITSLTLENKSSQDLLSSQIHPKMKKEESAATRSHILQTNSEKVNSGNTSWPKLLREGDQQKRSGENMVIDLQKNFQKDPEERMRHVWYYSYLPANLYCKCFLIIFLILTLVIVGIFIFMLYYNNETTTDVIEIIHHEY